MKERYCVTLNKSTVEDVKKKQKREGGKFSSLVESLLNRWLGKNQSIKKEVNVKNEKSTN